MENETPSRIVGDNLRRLRKERGLSLADVSARVASLGVPLSLNLLSKVELGNRSLELDELLAVARAVDAPPLLLIFPVGHAPSVEVFPGARVRTWDAARWFTGEAPLPVGTPGSEWADGQRWADSPAALFRDHDGLVQQWVQANAALQRLQSAEAQELNMRLQGETVERLRGHRRLMRNLGVEPNALPAPLRHVEDEPESRTDG